MSRIASFVHTMKLCLIVLVGVLAGLSTTLAFADVRPFPEGTKRGVFKASAFPDIVIDGKIRLTSPGTRIYGEDNLLIMGPNLPKATFKIHYLENDLGEIKTIWILTDEEIRHGPPAPVKIQINQKN